MVLAAAERAIHLPVPVLERPHWRVVIRPRSFRADRLHGGASLADLLTASAVRLRGWDYPNVETDSGQCERGSDYFASWVEWGPYLEYIRLCQSGQFVHVFGFTEDEPNNRNRGDATRATLRGVPVGFQPTGYVDYRNLLYTLTEVFEFASRLMARVAPEDAAVIEVGMRGIEDRLLVSLESNRFWRSFARATVDNLDHPAVVATPTMLIADRHEMALRMTTWFYERFDWNLFDMSMLRQDQQNFLNRVWD